MADQKQKVEPEVLKLTSELLQEPASEADTKADMIRLFIVAGATVIGALCGVLVALKFDHSSRGKPLDLWALLLCVALGSVFGCASGMLLLGARGLIRWERTR